MLVCAGFSPFYQRVSILMVPCSLFWGTAPGAWLFRNAGTKIIWELICGVWAWQLWKRDLWVVKCCSQPSKLSHGMSQAGRDHSGSLVPRAGLSQAQGCVQVALEYLQWGTLPLWAKCFSQLQKSSFSFPGAVAVVNNQVFIALVGVKCSGAEMRP